MLRRRGFDRILETDRGDEHRFGTVAVTATHAEHSGRRGPFAPRAAARGYLLAGSQTAYFAGDTDLFSGMDSIGPRSTWHCFRSAAGDPGSRQGTSIPTGPRRPAEARAPICRPGALGDVPPLRSSWHHTALQAPADAFAAFVAERAPSVEVRVLPVGGTLELEPAAAEPVRLGGADVKRRLILGIAGLAVVVATFAFVLPRIADYGEVWEVVKGLSWPWVVALAAAAAVVIVTAAPPWQVVVPGLHFVQALVLTQASAALSLVVPGGVAGAAASFGMLRTWGHSSRTVIRAVGLVSLWGAFLTLFFPIVAVFLLTITGAETAALATVAFVGVVVLGIVVGGFVLVLVSQRLAHEIGDVAARLATWARGKLRRGPVTWDGSSFERFRAEAGDLVSRRWHLLTVASLAAACSGYVVLLVSLRALGIEGHEVSAVEAFAAWALVRILVAVPLTPGGLGIVELGLTGTLGGFGGGAAEVVAAVSSTGL